MRFHLPWNLAFSRMVGGPHPLVVSYATNCKDHSFDHVAAMEQSPPSAVRRGTQRVASYLRSRSRGLPSRQSWRLARQVDFAEIEAMDQALPEDAVLFVHTAPLYFGKRPYIFHFESFQTLFTPLLFTGQTRGVDLKKHGYHAHLLAELGSSRCLAIFSHIEHSTEILREVMGDAVARKVHYVPLAFQLDNTDWFPQKYETPGVEILFTNSFHNNPSSFYLRGGHFVLRAVESLRAQGADVSLTILSSKPPEFADRPYSETSQGIRWIDRRVDDGELDALYRQAKIFASPSAGLHSYGLVRAVAHGCVPLVSDALGYDEFLGKDKFTAGRVEGVFDTVYRREDAGWYSDDYSTFRTADAQLAAATLGEIERLLATDLGQLAACNRERMARAFAHDAQRRRFNRMVDDMR
ncbi:glycosyltransferase [Stappia sp. ICDLI1TA098]|jgi:glycosyltransferase involved in cell wall biosynthesis